MDRPEVPNGVVRFRAHWDVNPYQSPTIVNQMLVTEGPGSRYGNDGLIYLLLGHVLPPLGEHDADAAEDGIDLTVTTLGNYAFTLERAQELVDILQHVIANTNLANLRLGGGNDAGND